MNSNERKNIGFRNALASAALMLFAGCASSPRVVPDGSGHYVITGRFTGAYNAGADTLLVAKTAKMFCAQQAKQMVVRNIENVSLMFSCESPPQKI